MAVTSSLAKSLWQRSTSRLANFFLIFSRFTIINLFQSIRNFAYLYIWPAYLQAFL